MTKFGKIFCNLVANFKGVQLSPLGFAACQSKKCTNKANSANYRRVWHPAIPTQPPNYLPTEATEATELSDARFSPTDCTDVHRLGGYGIPAIPTQPPNYLPTEPYAAKPSVCICEICGRLFSARSFCEFRGRTLRSLTSVSICEIRGRLFSARSFCEFRGRTSEGGVGMAGCHTLLICVHL